MFIIYLGRPGRLRSKAGLTIVEVITAMVIFTISMLGIFASLTTGFRLVNDTRENIIASTVIQEEIEELRRSFFASLPALGESAFANSSLSSLKNASGAIDIREYMNDDMVRVVVTVTWEAPLIAGKINTKRVVTLITRGGINAI